MTFPTNPTDYQAFPWTDPVTGIEWIYTASKNKWSRYADHAGGGVSSWNDLTDRPAGLLSAQAAATESIRAIGTTATTAMAGNATPTPAAHKHVSADITDLSGASVSYAATAGTADEASYANTAGTSAALAFGETVHAVSMSYIDDMATFTFGTAAAPGLRTAAYCVGSQPAGTHAALTRITHHYACTQAQYDALATKDANTIYDIY